MFAWGTFSRRAGAGPGAYLGTPALARFGISAIFTTRHGGFSGARHSSLNLSLVAGDDPAAVVANRDRAMEPLGLAGTAWTGGKQVHGTTVTRVTAADRGRGATDPDATIPDTDALWTDEPGAGLAVLVADCVPIVMADPVARRIAVVHAGWRGLVGGVIEAAAGAFDDPGRIIALAGPSIGPCCYTVGEEAAAPAVARFGDGILRGANLDLWAGTAAALHQAGVRDATLALTCTRCESHRFFSHRAGDTGRQGVLACLIR